VSAHSPKKFDVVVLGGINTDFVVKGSRLPQPGQTVPGDTYYSGPGGKAANQAVAAARLGAKVALIGRVGADDRGRELLRGLRKNRVDVRQVSIDPRLPTGAALIVVDSHGEKQISVALGANLGITRQAIDEAERLMASSRVLLMQFEAPAPAVLRAAELARKHSVQVLLDPAPPRQIPAKLFSLLDVIRPNRDEAEQITGLKIRNTAEARRAAQALLARGLKMVALEAPGKGDLVLTPDDEFLVPRFKVQAVDATGAGDAYAAGLAVGLAEQLPLQEAARLASATAALATTKIGAQEALPTRKEVERLLRG
jgi:ribokinase